MKLFAPLIALLTVLLLSSCSSSSPASRIKKNADLYSQLSVRQQELVSQGEIEEGMSSSGVFLALGAPDRQLEGSSDGKRTLRWDYTSLRAIHRSSFSGGFSSGFGGFGRRSRFGRRGGFGHGGGFGFGFSPSVSYVSTRSSTVWFENDSVRSYERVR